MDRQTAKNLRMELEAIFYNNGINGYDIEIGNASYNDFDVTFKVVIRHADAKPKAERDLEKEAEFYGLDVNKIGTIRGDKYTLVGFNSRARKQPWIVEKLGIGSSDNNKYKIGTDTAKRLFGRDVA